MITKNMLSINSYHYRRGGADAVYLDHAELMVRNGWKNRFFAMNHPLNIECEDSKFFADLVDFEYSSSAINRIIAGVRTIYNSNAARQLTRLLEDSIQNGIKFDVAHLHGIYHHLTPSILPVLKERGIKTVLTAHDLKLACPAYKMANSSGVCESCKTGNFLNIIRNKCIKDSYKLSTAIWVEAELHRGLNSYSRGLDAIIAPSKFYRQKLIDWGWEAHRVHYVPNFVSAKSESFCTGYTGDIIYFGRLSSEKGLSTLILASSKSGVPIDIVGDGPEAQKLRLYADSVDAPVKFHGRLNGHSLWELVGSARAVVLPSEWYENAPLSILEAFQLKRPVIGSQIGGIPELIDTPQGRSGWLFEPGNVDALSSLLSSVSTASSNELREFGENGWKHALTEFSSEKYHRSILEIYVGQ